MKQTIRDNGIGVLIVDPFISSHRVTESDNNAIEVVATAWNEIADETGCAIELVHHARKTQGGEVTVEDSRGAIGLINKARSSRALNVMSEKEANEANVENRRIHFRYNDGKSNLAPPAEAAKWFKIESINLGNATAERPADSVGVVTAWKVPGLLDNMTLGDLRAVQEKVQAGQYRESSQADHWVGKAIADGQLASANLDKVKEQVRVLVERMRDRRKGMIFAVNVEHAEAYVEALRAAGEDPALIIGAMNADERRADVEAFRSGQKRFAVTVAAALTGFDVPDLDLIASCRPTMSPIIHTQSIGRGTRPAAGKSECLVLDFAGNVSTFGPVHAPHFDKSGQPLGGVAPWRACRECATYNHFDRVTCTHCAAPLTTRKAVTPRELEFGTINFWRESRAVEELVARHGTWRPPVESIAVHAYRKKTDPTSVSCMISIGLGGDAIVRRWFKHMQGSERWRHAWAMLLGDPPAAQELDCGAEQARGARAARVGGHRAGRRVLGSERGWIRWRRR